jgi:hypothetical protein
MRAAIDIPKSRCAARHADDSTKRRSKRCFAIPEPRRTRRRCHRTTGKASAIGTLLPVILDLIRRGASHVLGWSNTRIEACFCPRMAEGSSSRSQRKVLVIWVRSAARLRRSTVDLTLNWPCDRGPVLSGTTYQKDHDPLDGGAGENFFISYENHHMKLALQLQLHTTLPAHSNSLLLENPSCHASSEDSR